MVVKICNITKDNSDQLNLFINSAGNSLDTFRYFSSRPFTVLSNHLCTLLLFENDIPVGYAHLDRDGENIWLGICIAASKKGKGYGNMLMERLFFEAKQKGVKVIQLSVDKVNLSAISLYEKYGFEGKGELKSGVLLMVSKIKH